MTAISAQRASETPSIADRTVLLRGSPATYANRAYLRDLGLRWDPTRHQWHGTTTSESVVEMRTRLGLEVRCFGTLEPPRGPSPPKPPAPIHIALVRDASLDPNATPRPHDGSRTHAEARIVYRDDAPPAPRFSEWEITSGLPDDSREQDQRAETRRLRELRAQVKLARATVATTPGLADILLHDWQKAARFYARFGVTEATFRHGLLGLQCRFAARALKTTALGDSSQSSR
jgi:hypothetical protein